MNFPAEPKIANWMKESRLSKVCRNTAVHCPAHHTTEGVKNICMNFRNILRRRFYTYKIDDVIYEQHWTRNNQF